MKGDDYHKFARELYVRQRRHRELGRVPFDRITEQVVRKWMHRGLKPKLMWRIYDRLFVINLTGGTLGIEEQQKA
jgi:hypothetical protein